MVFPWKPPFFLGKSHRSHGFPIRFPRNGVDESKRPRPNGLPWPGLESDFCSKNMVEILGKSWGNCWEMAGKWWFNCVHRIQSYLLRKWDWGIIYTIIWRVFCTFSDSVWIHRDGKLLGDCWEIMDMDIDGTLMGHLGLGNWLEMMDIYRIFKGMSALKP